MKKIIYLLLLVFPMIGSAQAPVMDASTYTPTVGATFIRYVLSDTLLPTSPAGAAVTWDFSQIIGNGSTDTLSWVDIASTGSSSFPNASVASVGGGLTGGTDFYSTTSADLTREGNANQLQEMVLSNVEQIRQFPFNLNDTFSDTFDGQASNALGLVTFRSGNITVTYDGYGTANFPGSQTIQNVFRLKVEESTTDSIDNPLFPFVTTTDVLSYVYYEQGVMAPLAEVTQTTITTPGGPQVLVTGFSRIMPNLVSRNQGMDFSGRLEFFPNPTSGNACVRVNAKSASEVRMVLHDLNGKIMSVNQSSLHAGTNDIPMDLSGISPGFYILNLQGENEYQTLKVEVLK